jgi:hypothetical protein
MKTIELSDSEFQLLGSLMGNCFCGNDPRVMSIFRVLSTLNNEQEFDKPNVEEMKLIYVKAPIIGKVVSYNVPLDREAQLSRLIKKAIQDCNGVLIDG